MIPIKRLFGMIEFAVIVVVIVIIMLVAQKKDDCNTVYQMLITHDSGKTSTLNFTNVPDHLQRKYAQGIYVDMDIEITIDSTVKNIKVIRFCDREGKYKVE